MVSIGNDWDRLLADEWSKPYYLKLRAFLKEEYANQTVYPPAGDIFNALRLTAYEDVKVVILGQDPYHEPGQAQGLAFSVPCDVQQPPSLVNIIKELRDDIPDGHYGNKEGNPVTGPAGDGTGSANSMPGSDEGLRNDSSENLTGMEMNGVLVPWTRQGVLLLNTSLTVRAHQAGSHRGHGWEQFTDRIIELLAERDKPIVFILWGANAGAKRNLIIRAEDRTSGRTDGMRRHLIIQAPHPSPLSAYRGFFGGRYFSRCNYFLEDNGILPIDWSI